MTSKPPFGGEVVRVGDVCTLVFGQSPSSDSYNADGDGLPFYQGNADFGKEHPKAKVWCNAPKKTARAGDILLSVRAPIGAVNTAEEVCCIGRGVAAVRPNPSKVNAVYLKQQLLARRALLESKGTGSTFKAVGKKVLTEFPVILYSLSEQEALARKLQTIQDNLRVADQKLFRLDLLVKSRFVEMFGDPVSNTMDWEISTIKETAVTYGDGPFGSNLKSSDYVDEGVRVIRLGNILTGSFSERDRSFVSFEKYERLKKYECKPGEVVIGTLGDPLLRACIVPDFGVPSIHKADCMYYETDKSKVLPVFAMSVINQPTMLKRAMLDMHGQTRARINSTQVGNLPMMLPPLALQQEFADFVNRVDKLRVEAQAQKEKLQTLYDSLAQDYFAI